MLYKTQFPGLDYAMNPVQGCSHGCRYPCYAYLWRCDLEKSISYAEWVRPVIVENTLDLIKKEIKKCKAKSTVSIFVFQPIHLCISNLKFKA
jgi:DNA repair photolyase